MSEKRFFTTLANDEYTHIQKKGNPRSTYLKYSEVVDLLNEQQELIEELHISDEMGWKRAERFEKKCPKELHNKKMYIKRLEYKVQKFKRDIEELGISIKLFEDDIATKDKKIDEQQATIEKLQDLCGKSDYGNAKLRLKNKELQEEIRLLKPTNVEQYEQIVQLQEENEQLRENLHNCRLNKNIISEKLKIWQDAHKEHNIYNIKDFEKLMKNDK